ncbi:hypothetical protein NKT34_13640 [Paenibacillus polysaccharolyticus]|uniref:portal protein n=1 Tax=Paenibacillus polysaccharolyticus TaxID=582692 RepID=UPI0020A0EE01|nr:hypothetical protein [Paenibacillus polysaccharolyticus]MCP1134342.1 hypothetical protein [Paenibacillus polysaccharolyticus]
MPQQKVNEVVDNIDQRNQESAAEVDQTDKETQEATRIQQLFNGAWLAKQNMQLHENWRRFDDYYHSRQGVQETPDDPNSNTNVIKPIIDSQIADLVDKPQAVNAKGVELSDDLYAIQTQHMLDFVLDHNKFKQKMERAEHDRLELGTSVYKVYFDEDALGGRGLPTYDVVDPANFFPDPKITSYTDLQSAEFIIHASWKPLSWFRRMFPKRGKYIQRQLNVLYDPKIYVGDNADESDYSTSQRALLLECYMKDDEGELYCITVSQHIILQDSREGNEKLQRRNMYPFVVIPCYPQRGVLWGQGDVELLIPTQDIVNELDDQIRINARLMGNPQIAFGIGAGRGFDPRKWTSAAGLRVPMRDVNAFRVIEGRPVSPDVINRREKAFQEADVISGRPDVTRGQQPSGVTAFRAIAALQQAGQKGTVHKKEMLKEGFRQVLQLLYDEMIEHWDEEMWVRIEGQMPDYKFYDPRNLREVDQLIPNEMAGAENPNEPEHKVLTDDKGKPMKRVAEFDLSITIGDGMPSDKAFVFDMITDLSKLVVEGKPVIFWRELREYLREEVGLPLRDEEEMTQDQQQMQGMGAGMPPGMAPEGMMPPQGAPMPQGMPVPPQPMPQVAPPGLPQGIPPEVLMQLMQQAQAQQAPQGQPLPPNVIPMGGGIGG